MHSAFTTMLCVLFLLFSTALTAPVSLPSFDPNAAVPGDAPPPPLDAPTVNDTPANEGIHFLMGSENFAVSQLG